MSYQSLSRTNSLSSVNSQKSSSSELTKSSKVVGIHRNDPFSRSGIEFTGTCIYTEHKLTCALENLQISYHVNNNYYKYQQVSWS